MTDITQQQTIKQLPEVLPPEVEEGNVEYKSRLVEPSESRLEHLITQMKYRLQEGNGEAVYEIGVEDKGRLSGLNEDEMRASLSTLHNMADRLGATLMVLRERMLEGKEVKRVVEVLVTKLHHQVLLDIRLAVLGSVDCGKSTLLGVLTQGQLDNGRGRARLNLFRHLHEVQTGRTSSICHEVMGFDEQNQVVNYSDSRTIEDIVDASVKLVSFLDLCGHHKYLKTTLLGLTGYSPDHAMLVVSASTGMVGTTKEHLGYALALGISSFVVINKVDMSREAQLNLTINQIERLIKGPGCNKQPVLIKSEDQLSTEAVNFAKGRTCPIICVSCVTGSNLPLLCAFFQQLASTQQHYVKDSPEFQVDEVFCIEGVGWVVGGTVVRGSIKEDDELLVGPSHHGVFKKVKVASIHRNKLPSRMVVAGQTACICIGPFEEFALRKGQMLLSTSKNPRCCHEFEADVVVLSHKKVICRGFQAVVHVANVRQAARIVKMNKTCLRTNDRGLVTFRFVSRPEFITVGSKMIIRSGSTKAMAHVTNVVFL